MSVLTATLDWFDSELQEEKSSWNTQKNSKEGAQVKKGLKTPYCRVGERPGLRVILYVYIFDEILQIHSSILYVTAVCFFFGIM